MKIINITKETKLKKKSDVLQYFGEIIDFLKIKGVKPLLASHLGKRWICREPDESDFETVSAYLSKNYRTGNGYNLITEKPIWVKVEEI